MHARPHDVVSPIIAQYWADKKMTVNMRQLALQLSEHYTRRDADRAPSVDAQAYWTEKLVKCPLVATFALDVLTFVVTEADVERSFGSQALVWPALRNRAAEELIVAQLWILRNFNAIFKSKVAAEEPPRKKQRPERAEKETIGAWLTGDHCDKFLESLTGQPHLCVVRRIATVATPLTQPPNGLGLSWGTILRTKWIVDDRADWVRGFLVKVPTKGKPGYMARYEGDDEDQPFDPAFDEFVLEAATHGK